MICVNIRASLSAHGCVMRYYTAEVLECAEHVHEHPRSTASDTEFNIIDNVYDRMSYVLLVRGKIHGRTFEGRNVGDVPVKELNLCDNVFAPFVMPRR